MDKAEKGGERVTNQEKKKYLLQYRGLEGEINQLLEEKSRLRAQAEKMTSSYSDTPKGQTDGNSLARVVEKIIELEEKLNDRIDKQVDLRMQIEKSIETVADYRLREVLIRRYILGQKWEDIALTMHYCRQRIWELHGKALTHFQKS